MRIYGQINFTLTNFSFEGAETREDWQRRIAQAFVDAGIVATPRGVSCTAMLLDDPRDEIKEGVRDE